MLAWSKRPASRSRCQTCSAANAAIFYFSRRNWPRCSMRACPSTARKTLDEGGYGALEGGGGSYRDILKDKKEAESLEQEKRVQKSEDVTERLIGEYETRLETEPNNFKVVRSLAELYTQKKQFDRALELYERVKQSDMDRKS